MRGSITKHPTGWRLQAYLGRHPATGKDVRRTRIVHADHSRAGRKEAERELAKWVLELDDIEVITRDAGTPTVADLLRRWMAARSPGWSPKTTADYRQWVDLKIIPRIGDRRIDTIRAADLDAMYADLLERGSRTNGPLSGSSVKRAHTILHAAFEQAVKWGEIASNPHCRRPARSRQPLSHPRRVRALHARRRPTSSRRHRQDRQLGGVRSSCTWRSEVL